MAMNQDVIELGSSDEEVPPPKKKKPMLNVMVQLPSKLPGITIKPTNHKGKLNPAKKIKPNLGNTGVCSSPIKININPLSIAKGNIGKGVTVTKVSNLCTVSNQFAAKNKIGAHEKQVSILPNPQLSIIKNNGHITKKNIKVVHASSLRPFSSLPPGITVKRTTQIAGPILKRKMNPNAYQTPKKKFPPVSKLPEIVDLDDDEGTSAEAPSGPQWYMRPEEADTSKTQQNITTEYETIAKDTSETDKSADLEQQNNTEPVTQHFIEITIEDSPGKPLNKRATEVAEMAITIDDSPIKAVVEEPNKSGSDEEPSNKTTEKHSKKELDYTEVLTKTVELEVEFTPITNDPDDLNQDKTESQKEVDVQIYEIEESPIKPLEIHTSTPKKKSKPQMKVTDIRHLEEPKVPGEFHSTYQCFIDLCFELENSEDMNKIVDKKIKAYYKQVPKEYTESEEFIDMVVSKTRAMRAVPEKMYLYIKDVVDELNLQRKIAKSKPVKLDTVNEEQEKILYGDKSGFDAKRQIQIRKLEKTLKKLHRAIQKLEEQEVDFDDEEDSVYLLTERYKERMTKVHAKFCQLTNTKMPSEPHIKIDARPGQPKGPAKRLDKWINKKVSIGKPLPFPDFHDVLRCVREANQEDKLCWNEADVMEEARDLFTRCGKKLQRRRQENEWRLAASWVQQETDPAEDSEDLRMKLEGNRRVASRKENEVLNKYADRQNLLNLEAVEIGDKEADESPSETDDDEPPEEKTSLEIKATRKESIKRLLKKMKKVTSHSGSQPDAEPENTGNVLKNIDKTEDNENNGQEEDASKVKDSTLNKSDNLETDPLSHKLSEENEKGPESPKPQINYTKPDSEKIHSLSDDSSKIGSDIDELHLLQKLHSDEINSSTDESSNSDSPIAISDSLSSGDNKKHDSDVFSIENSSYSESEQNEPEFEIESSSRKKITIESINVKMEIKNTKVSVKETNTKSNHLEYNECNEEVLLALSDDEAINDPKKCIDQEQSKNTKEAKKYTSNNICFITDASSNSAKNTATKSMNNNLINDCSVIEVPIVNSIGGDEEVISSKEGLINAIDVTSFTSSVEEAKETTLNNNKMMDTDDVTNTIDICKTANEKSTEVSRISSCDKTIELSKETSAENEKTVEASNSIESTKIQSIHALANICNDYDNEVKSASATSNQSQLNSDVVKALIEEKIHSNSYVGKENTTSEDIIQSKVEGNVINKSTEIETKDVLANARKVVDARSESQSRAEEDLIESNIINEKGPDDDEIHSNKPNAKEVTAGEVKLKENNLLFNEEGQENKIDDLNKLNNEREEVVPAAAQPMETDDVD